MSWLVTGWAVMAGTFTLVALWRLRAAPAASTTRVRRRPHVLLLRPVDAPTEQELENLAAPIDYSGEVTPVVVSPFRPRLQSANVRWLPSDPLTRNRKVGHLAYALATLPREPGTVVVSVDADVRVDGALLAALVDGVQAGAALVSAAPRPAVGQGMWALAVRGLLAQSHHNFEVLDVMNAGAKTICGKAIAFDARAEAELVRLGDCIGEDLELSVVLEERALPVVLASTPAHVPQGRLGGSQARERFTRWMQVLRAHRGPLFPTVPLFMAPTPVLMVLASWVASPWSAAALCLLVGARIALANRLDRRPGLRFEWLLGELLLLSCWVSALWRGRVVTWRGRRFELAEGGRMRVLPTLEEPAS